MPKKLVQIAVTGLIICCLAGGVVGCNTKKAKINNGASSANSSQGEKGLGSQQIQQINPQTTQGQGQIDSQVDSNLNSLDKSLDQLDKSLENL